jgi:hypothetical protein
MRIRNVMAVVVLAGCGEERVFVDAAPVDAERADAASPDAAIDAPVDAPVDAGIDATPVLTAPTSFAPALGSLCGAGYDHVSQWVWLYPCNGASVYSFTADGIGTGMVARPGEAANDVDISAAPAAITVGTTAVAAGHLLFINGESGVAEIHLPRTGGSTPLVTAFGNSHVVGGAYHPGRQTFFLVQDNVPATNRNTIAEIDPVSGAVVGSFSTLPAFDVSYGDLEVCAASGNLFLVSSVESTIAYLTPTGTLIAEYPLPAGVTQVSGIALGPDGVAWLVGVGGGVWRLDGLPCVGVPTP